MFSLTFFSCLDSFSSGGFLMMKVLSLCRGSTSDLAPHALHFIVMKSRLTFMTVSGLPQV